MSSGQPLPWGRPPPGQRTYIKGGRVGSVSEFGFLTSSQKRMFAIAAVLIGPALLKKWYDTPKSEVDLSAWKIVTEYDTPAIDKHDNTLRIEFCASCQVNGQFRSCATELQRNFPGLKIEGGPYTPPVGVQYAVRAVRAGQAAAVLGYFFGQQTFAKIGRTQPYFLQRMQDNALIAIGGIYGMDVIAQTLKSINAFEITYNGHVLHSKMKTGNFPQAADLVLKLEQIKQEEVKVVEEAPVN